MSENKINKIKKITASNDIEINGVVYFIPDKYLGNALFYLSNEHKNLYKYIIAMYLDTLIMSKKINCINRMNYKNYFVSRNIVSNSIYFVLVFKFMFVFKR